VAIGRAEAFVALARKNKLVYLGNSPFGPVIVSVDQVRDSIIIRYVAGQINKVKFANDLHLLGIRAAATLKAITALLKEDINDRDETEDRCAKLAQQLKQAQAGGGGGGGSTFTRQSPSPSDVSNTHQTELTIDPSGMSAHFDNSKSGGATWKIDYSWEVPQTITPGKSFTITLHEKFLSVSPDQPLGDQMNALAPDFAQAIQAHWPDNPDVSKTFTVPLAADQKDSSEITITIGFVSSSVQYHYRK
jgi:hypothetical protein